MIVLIIFGSYYAIFGIKYIYDSSISIYDILKDKTQSGVDKFGFYYCPDKYKDNKIIKKLYYIKNHLVGLFAIDIIILPILLPITKIKDCYDSIKKYFTKQKRKNELDNILEELNKN